MAIKEQDSPYIQVSPHWSEMLAAETAEAFDRAFALWKADYFATTSAEGGKTAVERTTAMRRSIVGDWEAGRQQSVALAMSHYIIVRNGRASRDAYMQALTSARNFYRRQQQTRR